MVGTGFPLVMYIHGGGWMGGDSHRSGPFADFPGVLASLSARGYVVASMEYRLSSKTSGQRTRLCRTTKRWKWRRS
jgi:acetyl esterase/lipase